MIPQNDAISVCLKIIVDHCSFKSRAFNKVSV